MAVAIVATRKAGESATAARALVGIEEERRGEERLNSEAAAAESRRAVLDAYAASSKELVVRNLGRCRARDVVVELGLVEGVEGNLPMRFDSSPREIGPGLDEVYRMMSYAGMAEVFTVKVTWVDEEGHKSEQFRVHT